MAEIRRALYSPITSPFTEPPVDVLCDISDSKLFKSKDFLGQSLSCLKLVLYPDAFEVVNPLGSARTKPKVLVIFASVSNLTIHVSSDADHMYLVLGGRKILKSLVWLMCYLNY